MSSKGGLHTKSNVTALQPNVPQTRPPSHSDTHAHQSGHQSIPDKQTPALPRSVAEALPVSWSERARAHESQVEGERDAALRFISRRHAHSESEEVLAARPFPVPTPKVARSARPVLTPVGWPVGAPPRPIRLQQLWGFRVKYPYKKGLAR